MNPVTGPARVRFATPQPYNSYCVPYWRDTARFVRSVAPLTVRSSAPTDQAHASYDRVPSPSWPSSIGKPQSSEIGLAPLKVPSTMPVWPPMTEKPRRLPWLDALVADVNSTTRDEHGYDRSCESRPWCSSSDDEESSPVSRPRPPSIFTVPPLLVATPPSGANVRPICPDGWARAYTHTCATGDTSVRQYRQCDQQRIEECNASPCLPDAVVESVTQPRTPSSAASRVVNFLPPPANSPSSSISWQYESTTLLSVCIFITILLYYIIITFLILI